MPSTSWVRAEPLVSFGVRQLRAIPGRSTGTGRGGAFRSPGKRRPPDDGGLFTEVGGHTHRGRRTVGRVPGGLSARRAASVLLSPNPADLINQTWMLHRLPVLTVGDAVTLPDNFLGRALQLIADDLRVATVSFLSNDAGFLSFPVKKRSRQPASRRDTTPAR